MSQQGREFKEHKKETSLHHPPTPLHMGTGGGEGEVDLQFEYARPGAEQVAGTIWPTRARGH